MKKTARTDVFALAKSIDAELSARQASLDAREAELQSMEDRIATEHVSLETSQAELAKQKAGFDALQQEVDAKLAKIRSDEQLSKDIREQAITAKAIEAELKEVKEERGLTQLNLEEIAKREAAVSEREKNYKEELKKEFAASIFKG